jgi:hypothetical protein
MLSAMQWGTMFRDVFLYFRLPVEDRPHTKQGVKTPHSRSAIIRDNCVHIAWMSMYLLIRGLYPHAPGIAPHKDIPYILSKTMGMNCSPRALMKHLASFDLSKLSPEWVCFVSWNVLPKHLQKRLFKFSARSTNKFGLWRKHSAPIETYLKRPILLLFLTIHHTKWQGKIR